MKVVLEPPKDKGFILFVNELSGDEDFVPYRNCYFDCPDSQRWEADRIVREEWEATGGSGNIFNQCRWVGATGWEFWSSDQIAILQTAMKVAERLGVELQLK